MQNASFEGAYDATLKRSILRSVLIEPPMIAPEDIKTEEDVVTELLRESSTLQELNLPADGRVQLPEICPHSELFVDLTSKPKAGRRGRRRPHRTRRHFPAHILHNTRANQQLDSNTPPIITTSLKRPCGRSISQQILQPLRPKPVVTSIAAFLSSPSVFLTVASDQTGGVLSTASPPSLHDVTLCTSGNDLLMNGITVRVVTDNAENQMQQPLSINLQQLQSLVQSNSVRTHPSNSSLTAPANQTSGIPKKKKKKKKILLSSPPAMHSVTLGPPSGNSRLVSGIPVIVGNDDEVPLTDIADDAPDPYSAHSAIERLYWTSINSRIAELGELIAGKGSELTKSAVLQKAIEHIRQLRAENQRLKEENKTLRLALPE